MADSQKNPLGPTGRRVRDNVQRLRESQRLSYRQLSDRLTELGRPIPTLGLSRIEKGERRVDSDDLVALADALGVHPGALLLPPDAGDEEIEITAERRVSAWLAWKWMDGQAPLPTKLDATDPTIAEVEAFRGRARPRGVEQHEAIRQALQFLYFLESLLRGGGDWAKVETLRRSFAKLTVDVEGLLREAEEASDGDQ